MERKCDIEERQEQAYIEDVKAERQDGIKQVQIPGKGRGIVTIRDFKKKEFIVEYAGEKISCTEGRKRDKELESAGQYTGYIYFVPKWHEPFCVDATVETGKLGRLINHSLKGNLISKVVTVENIPRLFFIAARDIKKSEECLYDYGDRRREVILENSWLKYSDN